MRLRLIIGSSLVVLATILPAAALGATAPPRADQYGDEAAEVVTEQAQVAGSSAGEGTPPTHAEAVLDALPFTGIDLAVVVAFCAVLAATGLALRGRRRTDA